MKISTAWNHHKRLHSRLLDLFAQARSYSWTHEEWLRQKQQHIYGDPAWNRVPGWVRTRIFAVSDLQGDMFYQAPYDNIVVWQLYENGERVKSEDVQDWSTVEGQHEWSKTGMPFSEKRRVLPREVR